MANKPAFEVIETEDEVPAKRDAGATLLLLGLKSLSQRAVAAIADLFTLVTVGLCFWLFYLIKDNPNVYQLVLAAMAVALVLAANWIVRRER